jgi:hypothetical protein
MKITQRRRWEDRNPSPDASQTQLCYISVCYRFYKPDGKKPKNCSNKSYLLSVLDLFLASVETATGKPRFEERVTFSKIPLLPSNELVKKLGNDSSAIP